MPPIRIFPRRTSVTPDDENAYIVTKPPSPKTKLPIGDEVHISVAFTWDMPLAEQIAEEYHRRGVTVKIGGPATGQKSGECEPGLYVKKGIVATSRGCPNNCWFCSVPRREGKLREFAIRDGWNIIDDNLLACSDRHIHDVFEMLKKQPKPPVFTGGLEAKLLKPWLAKLLKESKPSRLYFAYDTPDDYDPLVNAGRILRDAGFTVASHRLMCYVLIGWQGDTFAKAEKRLVDTVRAGFMPYAMLYRDKTGARDDNWRRFQREWVRPQYVGMKMKQILNDRMVAV